MICDMDIFLNINLVEIATGVCYAFFLITLFCMGYLSRSYAFFSFSTYSGWSYLGLYMRTLFLYLGYNNKI